jgi:HAMP domain-containing protein
MAHRARGKRRVPIGLKVGVGVTLVLGLAASLLFVVLSARSRAQLVDAKMKAAATVTEIFASSLAAPLDFEDDDAIGAELATIAARRDVQWVGVIGVDGKVVKEIAKERPRSGVEPAVPSRVLEDRIELARPVVGRNGKTLGTAAVVFSLAAENAAFQESRAGILQLCVLLALGTGALLVLFARVQIVRPLVRLAAAARDVEEGRTTADVRIDSSDEVGELASAFNSMSAAVRDREARLAQARDELREILDVMRQAIVVFDRDGKVSGVRSASAEVVFGTTDFHEASIDRLLYRDHQAWEAEPRAFAEWQELAFALPRSAWPEAAALAPSEVVLGEEAEARVLELELEPLFRDDAVDRVMLLATDVTERRRLIQLSERREQELASLRRVVSSGAAFVTFLEGGRRRLGRARELLGERPADAELSEAFQHLHTLRSEAHTFELVSLETSVREAEALLADLRRRAKAGPAGEHVDDSKTAREIAAVLDAAEAALREAERRFVELSPTGEEALRRITVDRADVERLVSLLGPRRDEVGRLLERLHARPLGELCATLAERAAAWAEALGKRVRLEIQGRNEPVPQRLATALPAILTHLVRNAIAHGIETPERRTAAGKEAIGVVRIGCSRGDSGFSVTVEDDGAGLRGGADGETAARLFEAGYSTASDVLELSGRGMGLPAARREARSAGYDVKLASRAAPGVCFVVAPSEGARVMGGVA